MIIEHRLVLCSPAPNGLIYDFDSANKIIDQVSNGKCILFPKSELRADGTVPIGKVSGVIYNAFIENNEIVFLIKVMSGDFKLLVEYWKKRGQELPYYLSTEIVADVDLDDNQVQAENLNFIGISWNSTRDNF